MKFLHSDHSVKPELMEQLDANTSGINKHLVMLISELHAQFDLYVDVMREPQVGERTVTLVTKSGLPAGRAYVRMSSLIDSQPVYHVSMPTIKKEQASKNSDRTTRDSVKLSSLIRTIKSKKEIPTEESISNRLLVGSQYCFGNIKSNYRTDLNISGDMALAAVKHALGLDNSNVQFYISDLKAALNSYENKVKEVMDQEKSLARFYNGCTMVGIMETSRLSNTPPKYLIGKTQPYDTKNAGDTPKLKAPLRVLKTLADTEIAPLAAMCRTVLSGYAANNELGVPHMDKYYPDLDISVGYSAREILWVAIPDEAPSE
jgi:hypothetical protein